MDNVFRIKKSREIRTKKSDTVSGTLDSIHQSVVSTIKEETTNIEELEKKLDESKKELEQLESSTKLDDILKSTKLREETRSLSERIENESQLEDYYLKNADIVL